MKRSIGMLAIYFLLICTARLSFATDSIIVLDGVLNGGTISSSYPEVTVDQGQSLTGSFEVGVQNDHPHSAITPLAATTTWETPQTSYWGINSWVDTGYTVHTVNVDVTAPTVNGTYYVAVAMAGVYNYDQLMSATHPAYSANWDTGLAIALHPGSTFENAITYGHAPVEMWTPDGPPYPVWDMAMAAVRVNVVPEPTTLLLLGLGGLMLRKHRA